MDLKALMTKLETISNGQILNEGFPTVADAKARADKEKTTGKFDKKEVKPGVTQYTRKSSTFTDGGDDSDTKAAKKKAKKDEGIDFQSSIAQALVEEFGYEVDESTLTENPHANDPAKAAAWAALSPEDQKWLGGADPTDQFILARAPNKGKPAGGAGGAATKPTATPAAAAPAAPTGTTAQGDDEGNTLITKPDGTTQVVGPDGKPLPNGGRADAGGAATKPAAVDPAVAATREKFKALMDKLEKTGGVSGAAAAPAAAPAAKPATGAATKPSTGFANTGGGAAVGNPNMAKQGVKEDPNEGNAFSGALDAAKDAGQDKFEVDGNTYSVKESVKYEDDQVLLAIKSVRI